MFFTGDSYLRKNFFYMKHFHYLIAGLLLRSRPFKNLLSIDSQQYNITKIRIYLQGFIPLRYKPCRFFM